MRFSQRIGKRPIKETLQVDSMDGDLRTALWNAFHEFYIGRRRWYRLSESSSSEAFYQGLWREFFKLPVDELEDIIPRNESFVREWFFKCEWYEVYDFIEYLLRDEAFWEVTDDFRGSCNWALGKELSGYRLVEKQVVPITDERELQAVQDALDRSKDGEFSGAREHLRTASALAFDRKAPDFRNSIKESISAVEAAARKICGDPKATLGQALALLENKAVLHAALKRAFSALYGYTSDADGIRHAMLEMPKCGPDEAKYMLVACSAFVSYLIAKSADHG